IVGDVFSKPIVRAIDEQAATGRPYDVTSLQRIYSSGAMWSAEVKQSLLDRMPNVALNDIMNSSEGAMATQVTTHGTAATTALFVRNPTTKVFTDDGREVVPGSDEVGMLAASGNVPIGYYKDAEKTATVFREIDGVMYSFPGDMAKVAADGSLILLGRGNQVINTGGEKVFPEEVEEALKLHPSVADAVAVGVPDEKFGEAITGLVELVPDAELDEADVIAHVKARLASYKAPKRLLVVDTIGRAPNGKVDYKRLKAHAQDVLGLAG
ncbi:MAG TPA: acyl-CoA synthetase, partial [Acidimicrobiales bacterium]|nr:acyl-CoA synthetase [Acidimicrobiales bacterium]